MCMVAVNDRLIKEAIESDTIGENFSQEELSEILENLLEEKIKANRRKRILKFAGSNIWEGNLEEMRELR